MTRNQQCFEACQALSLQLNAHRVPHAYAGSFLTVALGCPQETEEIYCITPGFKLVRNACSDNEIFSTQLAPWSSRLYVIYHETIPPVKIEVVPAGEDGPRKLDASTIMAIQNVPFLSVTEFVRAKLRVWTSRREPHDVHDIMFMINHYWQSIDINRINEGDMDLYVQSHPEAKTAWKAIKRRYHIV